MTNDSQKPNDQQADWFKEQAARSELLKELDLSGIEPELPFTWKDGDY